MKQKNMVLMVVAVGCGLVAAFLTSQMSARTAQVETVEVIVAAKDLPVGTALTKDDLKTLIKRKKVPKDAVPPMVVETEDELLDKRLSRSIRNEETINKADLSKGGVVTIPPGMHMVAVPLGVPQAVAGFVGPGARVDVLATAQLGNKVVALPLLVNMLVLAVDTQTTYAKDGVFPTLNTISFAVDRKQALLLALAERRGCALKLLLRNPEEKFADEGYDIDKVIRLLSDDRQPNDIKPGEEGGDEGGTVRPKNNPKPAPDPTPAPVVETVKVPVAIADIAPNTALTADLIAEKFKVKELRKEDAEDAITDLSTVADKVLKNGLAKGQWVTRSMVGLAAPKPAPQDEFNLPKPDPNGPAKPELPKTPAVKRNTHDLNLHTPSGTKTFRYEEVKPGEWKLLGEVPQKGKVEKSDDKPDPNRPVD